MIQPNSLIKMFNYNGELINKQTTGMTHEESLLQLPFEANCLNWVLGHIISSRTFPLRYVGEQPVWTDTQRARYRNGSANIMSDDEGVVKLKVLLETFNLSQERLLNGLRRVSYDDMCRPSGNGENTIGDSLVYFHFHEAHHIGQIIYLAQFAGKKGVWIS
ncbi:MAG: DinB family protein [Chloroflexi bacterium]|nr:DinB family protein [Chloroflexota bacterium]MBI5714051.1 DinB family protein [Chloroflexota bacterium]